MPALFLKNWEASVQAGLFLMCAIATPPTQEYAVLIQLHAPQRLEWYVIVIKVVDIVVER